MKTILNRIMSFLITWRPVMTDAQRKAEFMRRMYGRRGE